MSVEEEPRDGEMLAAELALGLLDDDERRNALMRLDTDPDFARYYTRWQAHAATLLTGAEETPPASVWRNISNRLPANEHRAGRVGRWQAATAASLAAAAALGVLATQRSRPPVAPVTAQPITLVALLTGEGGGAVAVAYDPAARRVVTTPAGLRLGSKVSELWVIPAGGKPIALSVIPATATSATVAPERAIVAIAAGATLAVSVEPVGGSPTGQPTGPVIASGKIDAT